MNLVALALAGPDGARVPAGLSNGNLELWRADTARDGAGLFALPIDETVGMMRG